MTAYTVDPKSSKKTTMRKLTTHRARINRLKRLYPSENPNKLAAAETTVSRALCHHVATQCLKRGLKSASRWLRAAILPGLPAKSNWYRDLRALAAAISIAAQDDSSVADMPFKLFSLDGNSKLPFAAFSALPQYTCPGAGRCLQWCYSFRAWRYPQSFCRQVLATMLLRYRPEIVAESFLALPENIDVRLYVDGDIESAVQLGWWCDLMRRRRDLRCYGYSKSWVEFLQYGENNTFPDNYCLNLSSGSAHDNTDGILERMNALRCDDGEPVVRNRFVGVAIPGGDDIPRGFARYDNKEYHQQVRVAAQEQFGEKAFSCPGVCGSCGVGQHMCGNRSADVLIAIGIH
jgi:hypothetical protein